MLLERRRRFWRRLFRGVGVKKVFAFFLKTPPLLGVFSSSSLFCPCDVVLNTSTIGVVKRLRRRVLLLYARREEELLLAAPLFINKNDDAAPPTFAEKDRDNDDDDDDVTLREEEMNDIL